MDLKRSDVTVSQDPSDIRPQILEALKKSFETFRTKSKNTIAPSSELHYRPTLNAEEWMLRCGVDAHANLTYFWNHPGQYCRNGTGEYIDISKFTFSGLFDKVMAFSTNMFRC